MDLEDGKINEAGPKIKKGDARHAKLNNRDPYVTSSIDTI